MLYFSSTRKLLRLLSFRIDLSINSCLLARGKTFKYVHLNDIIVLFVCSRKGNMYAKIIDCPVNNFREKKTFWWKCFKIRRIVCVFDCLCVVWQHSLILTWLYRCECPFDYEKMVNCFRRCVWAIEKNLWLWKLPYKTLLLMSLEAVPLAYSDKCTYLGALWLESYL